MRDVQTQIGLRRTKTAVPEQLLDGPYVRSGVHEMRREGMSQGVWVDLRLSNAVRILADDAVYFPGGDENTLA
jgi:hypothetical protein